MNRLREPWHQFRADAAAILVVIATGAAFHVPALDGWWLWDDPQVLVHAQRFRWWEALFDPAAWQWLSRANFTPLVTVSFEIDLALGGLDPRPFYAHHLLALLATAVALYGFLRALDVSPVAAGIGSLFFLTAPPTVECARALMTRHYVEGALLFLLAGILWVRGRSRISLAAAAILALLAMLAKELYVPALIGLVASDWLRGRRGRTLAVRGGVAAVVLGIYSVWRIALLGSVGGYGNGGRTGGYPAPFELFSIFAGRADAPWWVIWSLSASLLIFLMRKSPRALMWGFGGLVILAGLPILPVLRSPAPRYFFGVGIALAILLGLSERFVGRRALSMVGLMLLVGGGGAGAARALELERLAESWKREGVWFLAGPPEPTLFGVSSTFFLDGLREAYGVEPTGKVWLWPPIAEGSGARFLPGGRRVELASQRLPRLTPLDPAEVGFELRRVDGRVEWRLWPANREWSYVASPFGEAFGVNSAGWLRLPTGPWPPTREGEGWFLFATPVSGETWGVTPEFRIPREGESVRWGRGPE